MKDDYIEMLNAYKGESENNQCIEIFNKIDYIVVSKTYDEEAKKTYSTIEIVKFKDFTSL